MLGRKSLERLASVLNYATRQGLIMLGNALVAWFVLRLADASTWGAFIKVFLIISILGHVVNFGNREYLLRNFAAEPSRIHEQFRRALLSRAALLPIAFIVALSLLPSEIWIWVACWLIGQFLYQSVEVYIFQYRRFAPSALVEALGLALIVLLIYRWHLDRNSLVQIYAISYLFRFLLITGFLPLEIWKGILQASQIQRSFFVDARWFFFIGLSGLLQSRVDLYTISFFLSDQQVGEYQVIVAFVLLVQVVAGIILSPFSINLMRQSLGAIRKTARRLAVFGLIAAPLGVIGAYLILQFAYQLKLTAAFYIWSLVLVYPVFFYLSWIYYLYGKKLERTVMLCNFGGALLNIVLTLLLIQHYGILGALISSATVQVLLMLVLPYLALQSSRRST